MPIVGEFHSFFWEDQGEPPPVVVEYRVIRASQRRRRGRSPIFSRVTLALFWPILIPLFLLWRMTG